VSHYELIWIAAPTLPPEEVERLGLAFETGIKEMGANLLKVERWGKKKLAYTVHRCEEGYYTYYLIEGKHTAVDETVRRIRMNDQIIKFLSVRVDLEEVNWAANRRPAREERDTGGPQYPGEFEASQGGF